jgi:hypothetical protein
LRAWLRAWLRACVRERDGEGEGWRERDTHAISARVARVAAHLSRSVAQDSPSDASDLSGLHERFKSERALWIYPSTSAEVVVRHARKLPFKRNMPPLPGFHSASRAARSVQPQLLPPMRKAYQRGLSARAAHDVAAEAARLVRCSFESCRTLDEPADSDARMPPHGFDLMLPAGSLVLMHYDL